MLFHGVSYSSSFILSKQNPNDAIAEANLNLRSFYKKAYKNKSEREVLAKQCLALTHPAATGPMGQIAVSLELLSAEEARRRPGTLTITAYQL
jgi:hypothetical protein